MDKILYFFEDDRAGACKGQIYYDFLDYAFQKADYFMLVYKNYYGKGYTEQQCYFLERLNKFKVKSRTNPSWPGTLKTFCPDTTYQIVFYKTEPESKEILKEAECLSHWSRPNMPEDLAFFIGERCWFYSVGHEEIAGIIHADEADVEFLEGKGLSSRENLIDHLDDYYLQYDEEGLRG